MTCEEARRALAAGETADGHECAACASWIAARDRVEAALATRATPLPAVGFEGRLLERASRSARPSWRWPAAAAACAACAALLAVGLRLHRAPAGSAAPRPATSTAQSVPAADDPAADEALGAQIAAYDDVDRDLAVSADWKWATAPLDGVAALEADLEGGSR